ncbi:creatininase family protein [Occultella aeris]|uniref:Creatinine amidohydrolase n=1 Tax=Occultella aeris TaxID=2761496 RepID=A0A7M4DFJ9_9MICO|nr:creatininase family protein [Occultella aeris]VZO35692.1 Creatinine amidohydrolase [Occultella aeris]
MNTPPHATTPVHFDRLTRTELADLAPRALAVIPMGSTEQHGPHLPSGTDTRIITEIAHRATVLVGDRVPVVVLPTLPFGVAGHHVPFGATGSVSHAVYLDMLTELGQSLVGSGFGRLMFLNGHGGNDPAVQTVGARLVTECALPVSVAATSYWTAAGPLLAEFSDILGPTPGHAGTFETSCMLAIDPASVRLDRLPDPEPAREPLADAGLSGAVVSRAGIWMASDGRTDSAAGAHAGLGDRALTVIAEAVADLMVTFHASTPVGTGR